MLLTYDNEHNHFHFQCSYDERFIANEAGFKFNKTLKRWVTSSLFAANNLIQYADPGALEKLSDYNAHHSSLLAESLATDCDIDLPAPLGCRYLPYQKAGIAYTIKRKATLIGDDMGLGKTIQAIGAMNYDIKQLFDARGVTLSNARIYSGLIVCPKSLVLNWRNELRIWLDRRVTFGIAESYFFPRNADIIIINYEMVLKHLERLNDRRFNRVILDECHYIKNPGARRTKAVFAIANIDNKVALSGTPIPNRPAEIFNIVQWLDPNVFPSQSQFIFRYQNNEKNGASNLEELQTKLRISLMVRREKSQVLKDLPPKQRQIIELPSDTCKDVVIAERTAYETQEKNLIPIREAINAAKAANNTEQYKSALMQLREMNAQILAQIATLRKQVAVAKLPMVLGHLEDCCEQSRKVVVFAHHHEVMDRIKSHFGKYSVKFTGRESLQERQSAVEQFQTDPNIRLFIGGFTAAGVGITLTASRHCVFAELDWVPGNINQAEDRLHRIGQRNSVLIQHLVLEGSLDLRIAGQMINKQSIIERALNAEHLRNGGTEKQESQGDTGNGTGRMESGVHTPANATGSNAPLPTMQPPN